MNRRISPLPFVLLTPLALAGLGCPAPSDPPIESESSNAEDGDDDESAEEGSTGDEGGPTSMTTTPDDDGNDETTTGADDDDGMDTNTFLGDIGTGPEVECSVWSQDCPDGKCMPYSNNGEPTWNATKCVAVAADPGQPGDPCEVEGSGTSGVDTCDEAAMCWNVDPENNTGTCIAFCSGSENSPVCDNPSTTCSITNDGVLILCLPNCDPLQQNCEGDSEGCYGIPGGYVCAPDVSGEMGASGDPCEAINVCDAGLECMPAEVVQGCTGSLGCCTEFCDHMDAMDDSCTGQHMCLPAFDGDAPPGYESVGYCLIPA
jgi:hypothetical protein